MAKLRRFCNGTRFRCEFGKRARQQAADWPSWRLGCAGDAPAAAQRSEREQSGERRAADTEQVFAPVAFIRRVGRVTQHKRIFLQIVVRYRSTKRSTFAAYRLLRELRDAALHDAARVE